MNKTKIDWADMSWNVVTGCLHDCEYCYARKIANRFCKESDYEKCKANSSENIHVIDAPIFKDDYKGTILPYPYRFEPTFHKYRLEEPSKKKKGQTIFVCSMADLFGDWVPDEWIDEVFKAISKAPQHHYLFLTKNPERYYEYTEGAWQNIPEEYDFTKVNMMFGTTVTKQIDLKNISNRTLTTLDFLSIEPLLERIDIEEYLTDSNGYTDWVMKWIIVGAESGNRKGKVIPKKQWILDIKKQCEESGVPLFMKESLRELMGQDFIQEFPWEVEK